MSDRDRNLDAPILPAAQGVGVPIIVPEVDDDEYVDDGVPSDEQSHDAMEDDSGLLDTDSPEFDHSLRQRKRD